METSSALVIGFSFAISSQNNKKYCDLIFPCHFGFHLLQVYSLHKDIYHTHSIGLFSTCHKILTSSKLKWVGNHASKSILTPCTSYLNFIYFAHSLGNCLSVISFLVSICYLIPGSISNSCVFRIYGSIQETPNLRFIKGR